MPIDLKRKDKEASYFILRDIGDLAIGLKLIQMYGGNTGSHISESLGYCLRFHHNFSSLLLLWRLIYYAFSSSFFSIIDDAPQIYSLFII